MLTDEQCIEVAEKVWGWSLSYDGSFYGDYGKDGKGNVFLGLNGVGAHTIAHEVNSWQGFGRTVEAMEKLDFCFVIEGITNQPYFVSFFNKSEAALSTKHNGYRCLLPELFEATHLAALEAMK